MNKAKLTEILIKGILIVLILKYIAKWPNEKTFYFVIVLLLMVYVIVPLVFKKFYRK